MARKFQIDTPAQVGGLLEALAGLTVTGNTTLGASTNIPGTGILTIGSTTGGTNNGNITLSTTDTFHSINFKSGATVKAAISGTATNGNVNLDSTGAVIIRNAIGAGTSNLTLENTGVLKVPKMRTQVTFAANETSKTITHNFGTTNYSVAVGADSVARHVAWANKATNAVDIVLDSPFPDGAINVDVIFMAY